MVNPFEPTTTPTIDRANRLTSLKNHPGFLDLLCISKDLVNTATAALIDFGGWDAQQIMVLKARAQAAKEHHDLLIAKVHDAIRDGIAESQASSFPEKTAEEAVAQGDYVRQAALQKFDDMDTRAAGSFEPETSGRESL